MWRSMPKTGKETVSKMKTGKMVYLIGILDDLVAFGPGDSIGRQEYRVCVNGADGVRLSEHPDTDSLIRAFHMWAKAIVLASDGAILFWDSANSRVACGFPAEWEESK